MLAKKPHSKPKLTLGQWLAHKLRFSNVVARVNRLLGRNRLPISVIKKVIETGQYIAPDGTIYTRLKSRGLIVKFPGLIVKFPPHEPSGRSYFDLATRRELSPSAAAKRLRGAKIRE